MAIDTVAIGMDDIFRCISWCFYMYKTITE